MISRPQHQNFGSRSSYCTNGFARLFWHQYGLMTRNNLGIHISWLLTHKVTPPTGVQARLMVATTQDSFESFGIQAEDLEAFGDEDLDIVSSPVHERRVPPPPPIARPPIRPPPRVSDASTQETRIVPGATVMRKHDTGQSSTSSGVMTQHQLATPASTTASSVAPSSLAAAYTQMLSRERDGRHAT